MRAKCSISRCATCAHSMMLVVRLMQALPRPHYIRPQISLFRSLYYNQVTKRSQHPQIAACHTVYNITRSSIEFGRSHSRLRYHNVYGTVWGNAQFTVSKQDGREAFLSTSGSSMDQQHRTAFCALEDARSTYKPFISWAADFWLRLRWGSVRCLTDEMQGRFDLGGFLCVKSVWHVLLKK